MTPAQQQLADVAQAGEANACCLALGNTIVTDPIGGQELCGVQGGMFGGETTNTFLWVAAVKSLHPLYQCLHPVRAIRWIFNWLGNNYGSNWRCCKRGDSVQATTPFLLHQLPLLVVALQQLPHRQNNTILYIVGGAMPFSLFSF